MALLSKFIIIDYFDLKDLKIIIYKFIKILIINVFYCKSFHKEKQ